MRPRTEGFALLAVLAMLAVIALYTIATLREAFFGTLLAGTRLRQQSAFVLADLGIDGALQDLAAADSAAGYTRELHPVVDPQQGVTVELRPVGADALPAGFSAGRLVARRFEIHSTGHAARGARSAQVQGVVRIMPADAP
ncbi:MAG TPA: hypothetical protein VMH77_03855 [Steroidobacteraceae bacterium]|nr:hypothetical protein [Steroidobacteraceae bacterium]